MILLPEIDGKDSSVLKEDEGNATSGVLPATRREHSEVKEAA